VLGSTLRDRLFGDEDPIGKVIKIKDTPCKVVGVLVAGGQSTMGQDQNDLPIMPYTTAQKNIW
jgi:putative ABC transport system permease protein